MLDEDTREIFYTKDVVFPKSPEMITRLKSNEDESTVEDFYNIGDIESDYEEGEVSDGSTQRNNEDSNQETPQSNQNIIEEINSGPSRNTRSRREAMTSNEILRIQNESSDSEDDFVTAANITMDAENEVENEDSDQEGSDFEPDESSYFTKHFGTYDAISMKEYEEIWESAFTRFDVVYECYRTHKQDPSIPKNYRQLMKMKADKHPEFKFYAEAMANEEANMEEQKVYAKKVTKKQFRQDSTLCRFSMGVCETI